MATKTDFLELTLPDNGEYVDGWDSPVNNNFEAIDDYIKGLKEDLVGTTGDPASLGTPDLQTRLDAAMSAAGVLALGDNADYQQLGGSKTHGLGPSSDAVERAVERLEFSELELVKARMGTAEDRFIGTGSELASGIARSGAEYGNSTGAFGVTPVRGFTPNSVIDGTTGTDNVPTHLDKNAGNDEIILRAGTKFNIDGYYFEIEDELQLDIATFHASTPLTSTGDYYAWVSRDLVKYNSGGSLLWPYTKYYGVTAASGTYPDLTAVPIHPNQTADAGSTTLVPSGSVTANQIQFDGSSSGGTNFIAAGVKGGDLLVFEGNSPAYLDGYYSINQVQTATTLLIDGVFPVTSASVNYKVLRLTHPAFGFELKSTYTAEPGKVVVGEFAISSLSPITIGAVTPYAHNGAYDTGWVNFSSAFSGGVVFGPHHLGVVPTQLEIWVREVSTGFAVLNPTVAISFDAVEDSGLGSGHVIKDLRVPSFNIMASETNYTAAINYPSGLTTSDVVYTDYSGTNVTETGGATTHQVRVIARR